MSQASDEEEDYMSDAFLLKCEDKRPGLVHSSRTAKEIEREKKQLEFNQKHKLKPKKVLEQEKRTEGLSTAISTDNKGFSLMQKMGYKPGMVLGKRGSGRAEPVPIEVKTGRGGLGKAADTKRKVEERQAMRASMAVKRQRWEVKQKESFVQHMSHRFASKTVEKDLHTSQKACYQLDSESGHTAPVEAFHWPPNWKTLTEGRREEEEDEEDAAEQDLEEEEEDEGETLSDEEKLEMVTQYLRTTYHFCIWCGTKYDDSDDLQSNCPGDTADAHD
eukprot:GHVL01032394.1.p1 GENE.GHVL01032394.1~~GHVL01032394.1.p1  ORF type:complete len:275 (+),score=57.84 GHVL01032394.1:87-911(+)